MKTANIITVLGVVALIGGIGAFIAFSEPAPEIDGTQVEVEGAVLLEAYVPSLEAINAVIDVPVMSFVTVHESLGGAPGPIIAQSGLMEPGKRMTSMAARPLLTPGAEYIVLVHKDNGDSVYSPDTDLPITSDGDVLRADVVAPM